MESQSEKLTGTTQYWLEVHRIGTLLFQNIENGDSALKSLIMSIVETPLLSDIECLTGNNKSVACPFTSWILQGLLKACLCNISSELKDFYIEAQSKLLTFVYENNVCEFESLIKLYIDALEAVMKMKWFKTKMKFLLNDDYPLPEYGRHLKCVLFEIKNRREQIDHIRILLKVILSVKHLILNHCTDLHQKLLDLLLGIFASNLKKLQSMALKLLSDLLISKDIELNESIVKSFFEKLMPVMVDGVFLNNKDLEEDLIQIWNSLKSKFHLTTFINEDFLRGLVKARDLYQSKNFIYEELIFLSSEKHSVVSSFQTNEMKDDELYLFFGLIVNELSTHLKSSSRLRNRMEESDQSENSIIFEVKNICESWKQILISTSEKFRESNAEHITARINYLSNLLTFCNKILWKLDKDFGLLRYNIVISFFGSDLCKINDRLIMDLNTFSSPNEDLFMVAAKAVSDLCNLPEVKFLSVGSFERALDFLMSYLMSVRFKLPGFDIPLTNKSLAMASLFLRSLQCLPPGLPEDRCVSIFSKSVVRKDNCSLSIQAVKSVPVLYLTRKVPPLTLITALLSPGLSGHFLNLQLTAISSLKDFVCALAGTGYVIRNEDDDLDIMCPECSSLSPTHASPRGVPVVQSHLLKLLSEMPLNNVKLKHQLIDILPSLTMHMGGLKDKSLLEKLLSLLEDEDESIRSKFASCITSVIFGRYQVLKTLQCKEASKFSDNVSESSQEVDGSTATVLNFIFRKLEQLIHANLKAKPQASVQSSLLETVTNIACFPAKKVLSNSIRLLLLFINQPHAPLVSIFYEIAAAHRTTQLVLYYSYRPEISQFLGNLIVANRLLHNQSLQSTLSEITAIFKGLSESRFATKSENYILPILFKWAVKTNDLEDLLYEWAAYVEQPLAVVLNNTFQNIYTCALLNETQEVFDQSMMTIERLAELKVSELILHSQKSIINELLFNYHRSPKTVLAGLQNVIKGSSQDSGKESVIDSLGARFVGYLLFIVSKFVKDITADSEKVHAIQSLSAVIHFMGKVHVTPVARKVLATLQTTLTFNFEECHSIHFTSLKMFIETVEISQMGPLLATVITLLIPFLDYDDVNVGGLFTYLIVKNEKAVAKFLPSLIFLPNHTKLREVNAVMKKYINFDKEVIKDRLIRETSLALHETVRVRLEGLKALRKTIECSSSEMQNLINGSDEPDPCIRTLLEGLVLCSSDPDPDISVLAAACLGQLGAIDPGLLPRKPKPKNELPLSVHDPEFAFLALTEITRGFQNARRSVDMDAFAVAIQELLKMYQISPTSENGIWSRFPKQIQGLMTPMLSSRYKVQTSKKNPPPDVIFGSKEASSHISWASLWASKLIGFCKDDRAVILFKVCEPSLKCDVKVLLFFLRYILLQAVIRDTAVHAVIIREIESVVNWSRNTYEFEGQRTKSRPVRLIDYCGYPSMKSTITTSDAQTCAVTVFLLLDFLHSWLRTYRAVNFSTGSSDQSHRKDFSLVNAFLEKIDYLRISIANYDIREYSRAIMYLEDVIGQDKEKLCEHLPLLSKAYALYGDLDSVTGASSFQKTAPKMQDLLLSHQVSGQLEEVRIIFERLGKDGLMTPAHMQEMVRCYLNLGEPYTAKRCIESFTSQQPDLMSILSEGMAECLLELGDYSQLTKFLEDEQTVSHNDWSIQLGRIFVGLYQDDTERVSKILQNVRSEVAKALRHTSLQFGDYQQGYSYLVKLQILSEIEKVSEIINIFAKGKPCSTAPIQRLIEDWDRRCGIVQSDPNSLEPLLSIRRVLLNMMKMKLPNQTRDLLDKEVGKSWVKSAEIARKVGCLNQSYNYILNAEQYNIPLTFIEKAQLFWDKGDQDQCLFTLNRGIKEFFPDAASMSNWPAGERLEERKMCAEAKLLYAIYSEETSNCDHNTNITNYQSALDVCRTLEKSQAHLAQCLDRVAAHLENNASEQHRVCELKLIMVVHFGKSLMYGCEYVYQTVPRLLSIWLDLGEKQDTNEKVEAMRKINKLIEQFLDTLPPFILMTALPQLLSRLGHPDGNVFALLKKMLATLVKAFPQQCLWAIQAVAKSSVQERVKRYDIFIQHPMLHSLHGLIRDFTVLCDELNKLTNYRLPHNMAFRGLKVSSIVKELPRLLSSGKFSAIIVPITRFCSISLPRNIRSSTHEPFPKNAVYITGIEDEVTVLQSLQMPRKISFRGSDGKLYDILCKPTDDLRRDGRLMEFNNIVNMYLHRDPESRARSLHIRTYVVTPLGESGGLLEWVPNLVGLRKILFKLYKQFGKYTKAIELKSYECQVRDPLEKKRKIFTEKLLKLHPPIFPEWFRATFPDPSGWYLARQAYTRTTAVMSMVGYILGLGDRHGENILFDCESGDTVHVDFNCLFNKGERFDWKERVPFRLTHNMVAAMGPFGVEGTYRKSCEISLRVLRSQAKTLMSVLTPFAYDPFGSWGKNKEIVQNERDKKIGEAFEELSDIEKRLNGSLRVRQKNSNLFLSVEGQARSLIIEATNVDNLCQMYFGWGAYL